MRARSSVSSYAQLVWAFIPSQASLSSGTPSLQASGLPACGKERPRAAMVGCGTRTMEGGIVTESNGGLFVLLVCVHWQAGTQLGRPRLIQE